jgi:hypothetical protein
VPFTIWVPFETTNGEICLAWDDAPILTNERTDKLDPMWKKSNTDKLDPSLLYPYTLIAEPNRE